MRARTAQRRRILTVYYYNLNLICLQATADCQRLAINLLTSAFTTTFKKKIRITKSAAVP